VQCCTELYKKHTIEYETIACFAAVETNKDLYSAGQHRWMHHGCSIVYCALFM
jgi:hypothetical protein